MDDGRSRTTSALLGYPEFGRSPPPPKLPKPSAGVIDLTTDSQDDPPSRLKAPPPAATKSKPGVFVVPSLTVVRGSTSTARREGKAWEEPASMAPVSFKPQDPTQKKRSSTSGPYGPGWEHQGFHGDGDGTGAGPSRAAKTTRTNGAQGGGRLFTKAVASTHKPQNQLGHRAAINALPSSKQGASISKRVHEDEDEDDEETRTNERAGAAKTQSLQVRGGAKDKGKGKAVEPMMTIKGKGKAKAKTVPRAKAAPKSPTCITIDSSDDEIENADDNLLSAAAPPLVPPPSKQGKLMTSSHASASSPDPLALGRAFNLTGDAGPSRAASKKMIEDASAVVGAGNTKRKMAAFEPGNESFDAPPSGKKPKTIAQMKTRDGGSRTVDGLSTETDFFGGKSQPPSDNPILEYAIHPYRYGKLFPLTELDSRYFFVFNRTGQPITHTITLQREAKEGRTTLVTLKRGQLESMTLCANPENAIFELAAKCPRLREEVRRLQQRSAFDEALGLSIRFTSSARNEDARTLFEALEKWGKQASITRRSSMSQLCGISACRDFDQALSDAKEQALLAQGLAPSQSPSTSHAKKTQQTKLSSYSTSLPQSPHATRSKDTPPKPRVKTPPRLPPPKSPEPSIPLETVVLVWPFGDNVGTGSVTVTHGDTRRLAEGEFLNDTLIEFGLKRIFISLEQRAPELASKVHMFNSFFYKKLSTKKPPKAPADFDVYQTVKKWTQKFDFFDKDYIIVPINEHLHWYLAIIVNPGAILSSSQDAPPARRTRASDAADLTNVPAIDAMEIDVDDEESANPPGFDDAADAREALLRASSQRPDDSKSPKDTLATGVAAVDLEDQPMADVERDTDHEQNGALSVAEQPKAMSLVGSAYDSEDEVAKELVGDPLKTAPGPEDSTSPIKPTLITPSSRPPGSATPQGSPPPEAWTSGLSQADADFEGASERLAAQLATAKDSNVCYIFTFDSLGGNHNPVVKRLKDYLVKEALDKKKIEVTITPANCVAKNAIVPQQNNFHDCGVYLLHMVEQFLVDPLDKVAFILRKKGVQPKDPEIVQTWKGADAMAKRKVMRDEVQQECVKWAEYRKPFVEIEAKAALEKAKKREARREKEEREAAEAAVRKYQAEEERIAAESKLAVGDGKKGGSRARKVDKGKGKEIEQVVISDEESSSPAKEAYEEQAADVNSSQPFAFPANTSSKPSDFAGQSKPKPKPKPKPTTSSTSPTITSRLPPRGVQTSRFVPPRLLHQASPELGHSTTGHAVDSADPDLPMREHGAIPPPPPSHPPPIATRPLPGDVSSGSRPPSESPSPERKKKAGPVAEILKRRSTPPPKATTSASGGTHTRFDNGAKVDSFVAHEEEEARSASVVVVPQAVDSIFDGPSNSQAGRGEKWGEDEDEVMIVEPVAQAPQPPAAPAPQPPASASRGAKGRKGVSPELGVVEEAHSSIEVLVKSAKEKNGKGKGPAKEMGKDEEEGRAWGQKGGKAQGPETITIDDD